MAKEPFSVAWTACVAALVLALALMRPSVASAEPVTATVDQPAVITTTTGAAESAPANPSRAVIHVTAFTPPHSGAVQAVVKVEQGGHEQEVGRFGIFPNAEFTANSPSQVRRFGLPLPKSLAAGGPLTFKVDLVPLTGDGQGARMVFGLAEVR
jgi:hypothetical protein